MPSPSSLVRRYYLIGVVGVGKSTLREQLRKHLPTASIFEEFPKKRAAEVNHAKESLPPCSAEEIQTWIFKQLADKSTAIAECGAELAIIDRSPLDTFAFYPPQEWQARAQQMLEVMGAEGVRELASGELIFLEGSPKEIHARMDSSRAYSVNSIARQQSSFEILLDWLAETQHYRARRIDTRNLSPDEVAEKALAIIGTQGGTEKGSADKGSAESYQPLEIQAIVEAIAGESEQAKP